MNKKHCQHNSLKFYYPELCQEWDYEKNAFPPDVCAPGSNKTVWWQCKENPCGCHTWQTKIYDRTKGEKCPFCSHRNLCPHNNLKALHPDICQEWDYERNAKGPDEYAPGSSKKVWWRCKENSCGCHNWESAISKRTCDKQGCPFCSHQKVCPHSNLKALHPDICQEWDYERNTKDPDEYAPGSKEKVWWRCEKIPAVVMSGSPQSPIEHV